jgi:hypothetical protein
MRWPSTIVIALICAALGTALGLLLGGAITKAYRVSNFEGKAGYAIVFIFAPAGLLLGLIIGTATARMSGGAGTAHFFKTQGLALLITGVGLGAAGGLALLLADRPPKLGGNELNLEFEIRIPTDQPVPADLEQAEFRVSFFENDKNNRSADLAFDLVTRDSAFVTVPGTAWIGAHSLFRMLSAGFGGGDSRVFEIRLAPGPTEADTAWTDWQGSRAPLGKYEGRTGEPYQVRYRVAPVPPTA